MKKRIVIGISGSSGAIYGIELLKYLSGTEWETHLIITDSAKITIRLETDFSVEEVEAMADVLYSNSDIAASISSGSFLTGGMIIAPCTVKTLSAIANSYNDSLIARAADVTIKEGRKLVLMVRETPLHKGHLRLMMDAAELGAFIVPPIPAFYHRPQSIYDIIAQSIGKVLDCFEIEHRLFRRWDNPDT